MDRHPIRTIASFSGSLKPRRAHVKQHDLDVFYALVGGGHGVGKADAKASIPTSASTERGSEEPAEIQPAATTVSERTSPTGSTLPPQADPTPMPDAPPAKPVRRPPGFAAVPEVTAVSDGGSADWAAALCGGDSVPNRARQRSVTRTNARPALRNHRSWSPKVLCMHLVGRVEKLHVESWVRKVSGDAMARLGEAQARLDRSRSKRK